MNPPAIKLNTNNTKKMKNRILAIEAAPAAMPPKPKIAAIIATTKKITVQRNIKNGLRVNKFSMLCIQRTVPKMIFQLFIFLPTFKSGV